MDLRAVQVGKIYHVSPICNMGESTILLGPGMLNILHNPTPLSKERGVGLGGYPRGPQLLLCFSCLAPCRSIDGSLPAE